MKLDVLAVRCCCEPKKVLGYLPCRVDSPNWQALDRNGDRHSLSIRRFNTYDVFDGSTHSEAAIYSEDRGIDFWRSIPGFVEV